LNEAGGAAFRYSQQNMISKRRIMVGLKARTRERSCRQMGMRLRSASRVSENSYGRVRRSLACT
jgi:hypothetical protein